MSWHNALSPEHETAIEDAIARGVSSSAIAKAFKVHRNSVISRQRKMHSMGRLLGSCGCGKSRSHRGTCKWRLDRNETAPSLDMERVSFNVPKGHECHTSHILAWKQWLIGIRIAERKKKSEARKLEKALAPRNPKSPRPPRRIIPYAALPEDFRSAPMNSENIVAAVEAVIPRKIPNPLRDEARQELVLMYLEGDVSLDELACKARECVSTIYNMYHNERTTPLPIDKVEYFLSTDVDYDESHIIPDNRRR